MTPQDEFNQLCREMEREDNLKKTARALTRYAPDILARVDVATLFAAAAWTARSGTIQVGTVTTHTCNEDTFKALQEAVKGVDVFALCRQLTRDEQKELYQRMFPPGKTPKFTEKK